MWGWYKAQNQEKFSPTDQNFGKWEKNIYFFFRQYVVEIIEHAYKFDFSSLRLCVDEMIEGV